MPPARPTRDPTAMPVPWAIIRRKIAEEWRIQPWDVDAPELADEVGRWAELQNLLTEYTPPAGKPRGRLSDD